MWGGRLGIVLMDGVVLYFSREINGVNTTLPEGCMYRECLFILYSQIPLNENPHVIYNLKSKDMEHMEHLRT